MSADAKQAQRRAAPSRPGIPSGDRSSYPANEGLNLSRRGFLSTTSAVGGGLMVGFHVPGLAQSAVGASPELNAWVQILPDESETPAFLSALQSVATVAGVNLTSWTPQEELPFEYFAKVPMKLTIRGKF